MRAARFSQRRDATVRDRRPRSPGPGHSAGRADQSPTSNIHPPGFDALILNTLAATTVTGYSRTHTCSHSRHRLPPARAADRSKGLTISGTPRAEQKPEQSRPRPLLLSRLAGARVARVAVDDETWLAFRELCGATPASIRLGELVRADVQRAASGAGRDAATGLAAIRKQVDALEALLVARGGDVRPPRD
jgi:hypothetical protein